MNIKADGITDTTLKKAGGAYWLTSPCPGGNYDLRYVRYNGSLYSHDYRTGGVRPVVSISGVQIGGTNELITISQ